jgi:hypothetical protein
MGYLEVGIFCWLSFCLRICNIFNLECPQKSHVLKAWSPGWHYWEVVEPLRGGALWEVFNSVPEKGIVGPWSLSVPLSLFPSPSPPLPLSSPHPTHACMPTWIHASVCFPTMGWAAMLFQALPAMLCLLATSPKATMPTNHGLKSPKLWAEINPFSS